MASKRIIGTSRWINCEEEVQGDNGVEVRTLDICHLEREGVRWEVIFLTLMHILSPPSRVCEDL